jgi:hypothetical protein
MSEWKNSIRHRSISELFIGRIENHGNKRNRIMKFPEEKMKLMLYIDGLKNFKGL